MRPGLVFAIIWIGWLVSWIAAAFWSARVEKQRRATDWDIWAYRLATLVGANTTLITPFIVKKAASSRRRSPGRTRECSYASRSATAATPIQ